MYMYVYVLVYVSGYIFSYVPAYKHIYIGIRVYTYIQTRLSAHPAASDALNRSAAQLPTCAKWCLSQSTERCWAWISLSVSLVLLRLRLHAELGIRKTDLSLGRQRLQTTGSRVDLQLCPPSLLTDVILPAVCY